MRAHLQRDREVAGAEDLDPSSAAYGPRCDQIRYVDRTAVWEQLAQPIKVDVGIVCLWLGPLADSIALSNRFPRCLLQRALYQDA